MQLIHIEISQDWKLILPNKKVQWLTDTLEERLGKLGAIITMNGIKGGTIDQEVIFSYEQEQWDLANYLTEKYNIPFIYGDRTEFTEKAAQLPWQISYLGFTEEKNEYAKETLFTVGNGFMGLRGTTPEMEISDQTYPALYLAGLYDRSPSKIGEKTIYNEDFVNAPNLQKMYLVIDGEKVDTQHSRVVDMKRQIDLKNGLFEAWVVVKINDGKKIKFHTQKIASMANTHQYSLRYSITPLNFSSPAMFISEADGSVYNYNVERYRGLTQQHLTIKQLTTTSDNLTVSLIAQTKNSKITIRQNAKLHSPDTSLENLTIQKFNNRLLQKIPLQLQHKKTYTFEKTVNVEKGSKEKSLKKELFFPDFDTCLQESSKAWEKLWQKAAIEVTDDLMSQKLLNLHTYHSLISASPNGNHDLDVSVTARGLHGEAYRGHIFWDELFIFPFYVLHFPEMVKDLLLYRYRRLKKAKKAAQNIGLQGAMYPWQSGLDGSEQSQDLHLNPLSGQWKKDSSRLQRHVSLAIAYNIWFYWHNTQDTAFMNDYGLEMLLEIAHFWKSVATFDKKTNHYIIDGVMGPDEFHEAYPHAKEAGLKNNAYTNIMVAWLFAQIKQLKKTWKTSDFKVVQEKTAVTDEVLSKIDEISQNLALEIDHEGVIAQFEGYFSLKDLDWEYYKNKYNNIYRMDRILNAEGKSADNYQLAKQADTLMLFYNFSQKQVNQILTNLGYHLPKDYVNKNLNYYLQRTSHGSTLSRVVHSHLAAMIHNDDLAWQLYQEALYSDYHDIQGGTTAEGIHAGVMAATLYIPLMTFAGIDLHQEIIHFDPQLPKAWSSLKFSMTVRKVNFNVFVSRETLQIKADKDTVIQVNQQEFSLTAGQLKKIPYAGGERK
ncbi:MAG TPA: glycosyl hydrolase family 65 protein [Tetragenococcus sp.]|nr:glycosyl hydrolase family 65 protein [Tetragenococcus sp.]